MIHPPRFNREDVAVLLVFCAIAVVPGGIVCLLAACLWGLTEGIVCGGGTAFLTILLLSCFYTGSER